MPISITPVDWQTQFSSYAFLPDGIDQLATLLVDRADTIELAVVFGDLQHALMRDIFSSQYVFQEGHYVVHSFRAAEGNDQNSIDRNLFQRGWGGGRSSWGCRDSRHKQLVFVRVGWSSYVFGHYSVVAKWKRRPEPNFLNK